MKSIIKNNIRKTMSKIYKPSEEKKVSEHIYKTSLSKVYYIERPLFEDERGFFMEMANIAKLEEVTGEKFVVKQVNHSRSKTNVVRGMHAEGWNKLVRVISGKVFSALADVESESESFGQVEYFKLGWGEGYLPGSLYIEQGIANSMCVVEGPADYIYLVDRLYSERDPQGDKAISVFDEDLSIDWPVEKEKMILSERDKESVSLRKLFEEKYES